LSDSKGAILCEQAYAQGKMLDHSEWVSLPRGITPSDVDFAFDNKGRMILCELSSKHSSWADVPYGQRLLYQNLVTGSPHVAALCRHNVPRERAINTRVDVSAFQLMFSFGGELFVSIEMPGDAWARFVTKWFESPSGVLRSVLSAKSTKQIGRLS
jgi:hypothetical protein